MTPAPRPTYHLTRFAILRMLGLVYLVAFAIVILQGPALIGEHGLLPGQVRLDRLVEHFGSLSAAQGAQPTIFHWTGVSDTALRTVGWVGRPSGGGGGGVHQRSGPARPVGPLHVGHPRRPGLLGIRLGEPTA